MDVWSVALFPKSRSANMFGMFKLEPLFVNFLHKKGGNRLV